MSENLDRVAKQGDISSVIALFKYGKGNYKSLFLSIIAILLSSATLMLSAKLMGQLAEALVAHEALKTIILIATGILAFETLHLIIYYYGRVGLARVTNQVAYGIRLALFDKLGKLPIPYFDKEPLGRTITRLTSDVEGIEAFFSNTLPRVFTAVITITAVLLAMLFTNFKIGIIIVLSSLPAIIFTVALRRPVRTWLREYKKRAAALNSQLAEYINGMSVIKIFGIEAWTQKNFTDSSKKLLDAAISLMNWNSFIRPLAALLCALPIVMILYHGGHQVIEGTLSIGVLVAFVRYGERYFRPIMMLSFELHLIQDAIASSERVRSLLDEENEDAVFDWLGQRAQKIKGEINYTDVWMEYAVGKPVLKGVSFQVKPGESVALVGQTGSGKTSTVQLLPQLYQISSGNIWIDGIELKEWSPYSIRQQMGIVSQEVTIFHGTIKENLLAALPDSHQGLAEQELEIICKRTGLWNVLGKMSLGLESMCLDNGSNLSMGERQLIAFTRMLIRDPSILVLDEATANIDESYEALIQKTLKEVLKGRTTFVIAHRLNTIKDCDKILVFEKGRVVESGNHETLLKAGGVYAELVARQV